MPDTTKQTSESQSDKFKALARKLEVDEDEARWDKRMEKVAKHKMVNEKDQLNK